ncbi:hypothetical protein EB796_003162 [Bugula neritina]|uniref:Uncharacterized protein n=1 Tax=Bugula neritina TaxID=10212 RepID=A0A7J7KIK4_BUGNE|nr:hypothetical protein EB796_003162 [Bugula neritina]
MNPTHSLNQITNALEMGKTRNRNSDVTRCPELSNQNDQLTSHVTGRCANFKFKIQKAAILLSTTEEERHISRRKTKFKENMEIITTTNEQTTAPQGIYSMLKPPVTEYCSSLDSFSPDYQLEFDELFNEKQRRNRKIIMKVLFFVAVIAVCLMTFATGDDTSAITAEEHYRWPPNRCCKYRYKRVCRRIKYFHYRCYRKRVGCAYYCPYYH